MTPLAGLEEEQRLIRECGAHPAHGALRHVFLARRESAKVPNLAPSNRRWSKIGIVGAGKMGSGEREELRLSWFSQVPPKKRDRIVHPA